MHVCQLSEIMARLCSYYSLCPLIDQKSLLGVAEDSTSDCVIVTLGKNIVIRYKLLHQKQISSWSSKEKLSSPVIYDEVGKQYIGVFNRNQIRTWTENEVNLDKIKKIKFQQQIHCVLPQTNGNEPLIIFNNGAVCSLSTAIENRKDEHETCLLASNEVIEDHHLVTFESHKFITLFSRSAKQVAYFRVIPVSKDVPAVKLKVDREKVQLRGQTTMQLDSSCNFLTFWSDGRLFSLSFFSEPHPEGPGTLVNVVRAVSVNHPVAMAPLSSSHVAMYGADPSEEGAVLIIYNIHYGVVQSRHHFKLFASLPRLWCAGTNILITTAHHLVVAPFKLETQRLSALVGANCNSAVQSKGDTDLQELHHVQCVKWMANGAVKDTSSNSEQVPKKIRAQLQALQADGCPQSVIVEKLLPQLLETKVPSDVQWCLNHFADIPERSLVQMLHLCLENFIKDNKQEPFHQLLHAVLHTPFSDVYLLPCLRSLPFSQALVLLQYFADELEAEEPVVELNNLIQWTSLLLDAHYQRYLLSGDPQVFELLQRLKRLVIEQASHMNDLKSLLPILQQFQKGKLSLKKPQFANKFYSIELLRLY